MAEATEIVSVDKDGTWRMDAAAFVPKPDGYIKIKHDDGEVVAYPIYSYLDIEALDSYKVARLAAAIDEAKQYDEDRTDIAIEQILLLNKPAEEYGEPRLTKEVLKGKNVRPRHILMATWFAASIKKGATEDPQEAAAETPSASPTPSPASAGSTDGDPKTSSD